MAINTQPLEERVGQVLMTEGQPAAQADPMPAEPPVEPIAPPTSEPGTPDGDPLQVAGAFGLLRKTLRQTPTKSVRDISPEAYEAAPGDLPPVTTEGRFKVIPEADEQLTGDRQVNWLLARGRPRRSGAARRTRTGRRWLVFWPVAAGSRVPQWPTRRTLKTRRTVRTTSKEVTP